MKKKDKKRQYRTHKRKILAINKVISKFSKSFFFSTKRSSQKIKIYWLIVKKYLLINLKTLLIISVNKHKVLKNYF